MRQGLGLAGKLFAVCILLAGCGEKVNQVSRDVHKYKDINQELQKLENYQSAAEFREKLGEPLKQKIAQFEKHFDVEIKYVAKGCLRQYLKEEQVIKSFDYIIQNLKYPRFSKLKNIVLGCDITDLSQNYKPGYFGSETEYSHLWVREYYDKYVSNENLITDNSYDPYSESVIQGYVSANIATINSTKVSSDLLIDHRLVAFGCQTYSHKKIDTFDYDGLRLFLEQNKGSLYIDYEIPALMDNLAEKPKHVFALFTQEGRKITYRIGDSSVGFDILIDPKKAAALGNVAAKLNYATCTDQNNAFTISLDNYKVNGSGKVYALETQRIAFDYDGKLKTETKSEPLNPKDDFTSLEGKVSESDRLLPDENFDFDTTFSPAATVKVGVLDSGVDYNHPSLFWRILRGTGKIIGFDGYDLSNNLPYDHHSHGTHVSGIAMKGSQKLQLIPIRMNIFTDEDTFLELVDAAVASGVQVINVSLGWFSRTQGEEVFKGLIKGINKYPKVIFVLAAGNESANLNVAPIMPACLNTDNIIVVAATDEKNEIADFSNFGKSCIDVAAPGVDINSSVPSKYHLQYKSMSFGKMSGTSMAAPFVTNVVAKMLAINPSLSPKQVKDILTNTSFKTTTLKNLVKAGGYVFPEDAYKGAKNGN